MDVNEELKFVFCCCCFFFVFFFLGGGVGSGVEELKFFGKFTKKKSVGVGSGGGGGVRVGGVRVDVNEEFKSFVKIQKKKWGVRRGRVGGSGWM